MSHQGEILQEAIKNSGISITRIVDELGITRPTIYRKFKEETLDYAFVKRVGEVIGHDFSQDFTVSQQAVLPFTAASVSPPVTQHAHSSGERTVTPRYSAAPVTETDPSRQLLALQQKYIALLEAYNELLLKVYGPK